MQAFCISIVFGLLAIGSSLAQTNAPPAKDNATNALSLSLWMPRPYEPRQAPATIHMFARVVAQTPAQKGDVVRVDFFADARLLGSGQAIWHDGMRPDPHSNRPQPMIVSLPGFSPAVFTWSNAPAGNYTLTAQAAETNGMTAISPPMKVTVLP